MNLANATGGQPQPPRHLLATHALEIVQFEDLPLDRLEAFTNLVDHLRPAQCLDRRLDLVVGKPVQCIQAAAVFHGLITTYVLQLTLTGIRTLQPLRADTQLCGQFGVRRLTQQLRAQPMQGRLV